jgi:hypothetical protein
MVNTTCTPGNLPRTRVTHVLGEYQLSEGMNQTNAPGFYNFVMAALGCDFNRSMQHTG